MAITTSGGTLLTPPTCVPSRFGLLSVAEVEDRSDAHWEMGVSADLETCEDLFAVTPCPGNPTGIKDPDGGTVDTIDGDPFTIVAGYRCSLGGRPPEEAWEHAATRLSRGEGRTLERTFWTGRDVSGNAIRQSLAGDAADAQDVTPTAGTAVSITDGIALLEAYAGEEMSCAPILHASRGLAVYLAERSLVARDGQTLRSVGTDSRVVVGGGYPVSGPGGVAAAAGTGWLFVSGGIKVVRGATYFTPERGNMAASVNRANNDQTVFAERPYAFVRDCGLAAVLVNLKSCCC